MCDVCNCRFFYEVNGQGSLNRDEVLLNLFLKYLQFVMQKNM